MKRWRRALWVLPMLVAASASFSQTSASPTQRLRGTVTSFGDGILVMVERSGETLRLTPADTRLLVPGAKVVVTAQLRDGQPVATRALAGRQGFVPPM